MEAKQAMPWIDHKVSIGKQRYTVKSRIKLNEVQVTSAMMDHFLHHNRKKPW
jgi:hypothetical protein